MVEIAAICGEAMGLSEHAAIHHQHAIEYANRMGSKDTPLARGWKRAGKGLEDVLEVR